MIQNDITNPLRIWCWIIMCYIIAHYDSSQEEKKVRPTFMLLLLHSSTSTVVSPLSTPL